MKNFKSSISTSMERAPISVAPSGRAATKAFAALLVLELAVGTFGCSKSKPQNSQNSSNQTVASVAPLTPVNALPATANQPETAKKSVIGPVRKLSRTLLYKDSDSNFSFAYPRKSALKAGQNAELEAIAMDWLPMNFVQNGGTTVTMLELPSNSKEQKLSGEFFAVSIHNGLTEKANAMPISKVTVHGIEYSELDRQTEQGIAKYYHRFVPESAEVSSCYEFALAVKSPEKKLEGESASISSNSQLERKDDFARLEKILASVKIKADTEAAKAGEVASSTTDHKEEVSETAKTVAKGDENPR